MCSPNVSRCLHECLTQLEAIPASNLSPAVRAVVRDIFADVHAEWNGTAYPETRQNINTLRIKHNLTMKYEQTSSITSVDA